MTMRAEPSLLDRLTDADPSTSVESRPDAPLTPGKKREIIKRDLSWLLSAVKLEPWRDLEDRPNVARSVVNYGVRDYSGLSSEAIDPMRVQSEVRAAIIDYEPRIAADTLSVNLRERGDGDERGVLDLEIRGEVRLDGWPSSVLLLARLDLESGVIRPADGE